MTLWGWIFMLCYWIGLTGLVIYCLAKTLYGSKPNEKIPDS